jgi:Fe-S-cluster containining protein
MSFPKEVSIKMQFIPWQNIADWHCKACSYCCKLYGVVINFQEWLNIAKTFGVETTVAGLERFYIKRTDDGSCTFLCYQANNCYCSLQNIKPQACKIWPFKVLSEPKYGQPKQAAFDYGGLQLYVYADTMCSGLREFAELALGVRKIQCKTTRPVVYQPKQQWGRQLFP